MKASPIFLGSGLNRPWTIGSLLSGFFGSFASRMAPMYSEWSVTAVKSSGPPELRMLKPAAWPIAPPLAKA